jgi:hypothetical protein
MDDSEVDPPLGPKHPAHARPPAVFQNNTRYELSFIELYKIRFTLNRYRSHHPEVKTEAG